MTQPFSPKHAEDPEVFTSLPAWVHLWHMWKVLFPRRSIQGRLVWGRVWRRHDGQRWLYKPFVEFNAGKQGGSGGMTPSKDVARD
jgi:hypothetical protein